jgi:hypothetical protein
MFYGSVVGGDTQTTSPFRYSSLKKGGELREIFNLALVGSMPVANWMDCIDTGWLTLDAMP